MSGTPFGTLYRRHYAPKCEHCFKAIIENTARGVQDEGKLFYRKNMTVCSSCRDKFDRGEVTHEDDQYRAMLRGHYDNRKSTY